MLDQLIAVLELTLISSIHSEGAKGTREPDCRAGHPKGTKREEPETTGPLPERMPPGTAGREDVPRETGGSADATVQTSGRPGAEQSRARDDGREGGNQSESFVTLTLLTPFSASKTYRSTELRATCLRCKTNWTRVKTRSRDLTLNSVCLLDIVCG